MILSVQRQFALPIIVAFCIIGIDDFFNRNFIAISTYLKPNGHSEYI